jgi:hypothetical protein
MRTFRILTLSAVLLAILPMALYIYRKKRSP